MWASAMDLGVLALLVLVGFALHAAAVLMKVRAAQLDREAAARQELEREVARLRAEAELLRAEADARRDQMARFKRALWANHGIAVVDLLDPPELDPEPPAAGADQGSASAEAA